MPVSTKISDGVILPDGKLFCPTALWVKLLLAVLSISNVVAFVLLLVEER